MINNVVANGRVFAIDTETQKVMPTRDLGYMYVESRYFIEKAGKFTFPKKYNINPIDVESGDLIIVFSSFGSDNYTYSKANLKDAVAILDDIDNICEERSKNKCKCREGGTCMCAQSPSC